MTFFHGPPAHLWSLWGFPDPSLNHNVYLYTLTKCTLSLHHLFVSFSCKCIIVRARGGQAGRFRCGRSAHRHADQTQHVCGHTLLDGPRGHQTVCLWLKGEGHCRHAKTDLLARNPSLRQTSVISCQVFHMIHLDERWLFHFHMTWHENIACSHEFFLLFLPGWHLVIGHHGDWAG